MLFEHTGDPGRRRKITHLDGFIEDVTEARLRERQLRERSENLTRENLHLRALFKDRYRFGKIIGKSASMQEVYEGMLQAADRIRLSSCTENRAPERNWWPGPFTN